MEVSLNFNVHSFVLLSEQQHWPVCFGILSGELDPLRWCVHQSFNWPHQDRSPFSPIITDLDLEEVQRILVPGSESNPVVSVLCAPLSLSKLVPGTSFVVCLNMFHGERKITWCKHLYLCCKVITWETVRAPLLDIRGTAAAGFSFPERCGWCRLVLEKLCESHPVVYSGLCHHSHSKCKTEEKWVGAVLSSSSYGI